MQTRYDRKLRTARVGEFADGGPRDVLSLINEDPSAKQVSTITADSASDSTQYDITVQGVALSFTSDASATVGEIAAGLRAAIVADAVANAGLNVTVSAGVVTLTSLYAGTTFTVTSDEADLTVATSTAADSGDPIEFGSLVLFDPADTTFGRLFKAANLAARTRTITVAGTAENSKTINVALNIDGVSYLIGAVSPASATATNTATAIRDAINAALPADTVIATSASGVVTLTAEVAGVPFDVTATGVATSTMTVTVGGDAYAAADDFSTMLAGIAVHEYTHEVPKSGNAKYEANVVMSVARSGRINVTTAETVSRGKPVFVSTSDGLTFRASAASGYVQLPAGKFEWAGAPESTIGTLQLAC